MTTMMASVGALLLTLAPAPSVDDAVNFAGVRLQIGMSCDAVATSLRERGFIVNPVRTDTIQTSGTSTKMVIAQPSFSAKRPVDYAGSLECLRDRLVLVQKTWSQTDVERGADVAGRLYALASQFVSESRVDCRLRVQDGHPEPGITQQSVTLECGRKAITILSTSIKTGEVESETTTVYEVLR